MKQGNIVDCFCLYISNFSLFFFFSFLLKYSWFYSVVSITAVQQSDSVIYTRAVLSYSIVSNSLQPHGLYPTRFLYPWGFSRQEYWSGLPSSPQGIFSTQRLNPGLPHCRQILYCLSHQESPTTREAHKYTHTFPFIIFFFHYGPSQDTEHSSLYYMAGLCHPSIPHVKAYIY